MDPFQQPPATPPVSIDPPTPEPSSRGRGRMVTVAIVSAGLLGLGVTGVGALVSADPPTVVGDDGNRDENTGRETAEDSAVDGAEASEVQIVVTGPSGESLTVELAACLGDGGLVGWLDELPELEQWAGEWTEGWPDGWSDEWQQWLEEWSGEFTAPDSGAAGLAEGTTVTVTGPDGVEFYSFTGDGEITITSENGTVAVTSEGDVTRTELDQLFGEFGEFADGMFDERTFEEFADELEAWLDDAGLGDLMEELESGEFESGLDLAAIDDCLRQLEN